MPIRSIERQLDSQGALGNLPRWGKLHKGAVKTDKGTVGRDQDHFRLSLDSQYEDMVRPAFERLFTAKPTEFRNVFIAADSADTGFKYWYEEWAHARLLRRCDGEEICVTFSEAEQRYDQTPHECTCNPLDRACHQRGTMDIVIPELCMAINAWGKLTILTGSVYDIIALRSSMRVANMFARNLPEMAFWSIPFRIGRALRTVPVTINGKRSMKPMSLLYADPEPEFNEKVFSPMFTAPTRALLAGVNVSTGEMPDVVIEQSASWDRDYVNAQTIHLFDHENHQANAIDKMIADGAIDDDATDEQVIQAILENREQRQAEKAAQNASQSNVEGSNYVAPDEYEQSGLEWVVDAKTVNGLMTKAETNLGLTPEQVLQALQWAMGNYTIQSVAEFVGTKEDAWGACVVHKCGYDPANVISFILDPTSLARIHALALLDRIADIPF